MMIRWINNIQAHWGLPCAYRLGKEGGGGGGGGGGGSGCAGHSEA